MRILMTTDTVGGVWTFTQELTRGLLQNGCAVALVSFGTTPSDAQVEWCRDFARAWGSSFQYQASDIPLEWMVDNCTAYSHALPLLISVARQFKPDVLQTNQYCFGALPLDIPKIIVAHSDVLSWAGCQGRRLDDSDWLRRYRALVTKGLAEADYIVAPTQWMLEALEQHFTMPHKRSVIANGRSVAASQLWPRKMQAVTAGRIWDEAKNISIFRNMQSPVPLLIAGELLPATDYDRPRFATFVGRLPEQKLLALFRESSIYICTSVYEPFGLAPLEAAQCGCAVVANDIPSLREVWQDAALYFSDAASLTTLLHELSRSPELLHAAQQKSLAQAGLFTGERMVQHYLRLFRKALTRSERASYAS